MPTTSKTTSVSWKGVVKKLNAYNKLAQTLPSILLAQSAIREILTDNQPIPVTVERIISEVGRTFGVSAEDIRSSKRSSQISNARQDCYVCHPRNYADVDGSYWKMNLAAETIPPWFTQPDRLSKT